MCEGLPEGLENECSFGMESGVGGEDGVNAAGEGCAGDGEPCAASHDHGVV